MNGPTIKSENGKIKLDEALKENINGAKASSRKNSCLDSQQAFKLASWLLSMKDELVRSKPGAEHVAKVASESLGFHVSVSNLERAQKMSEVRWSTPRKKSAGNRVRNKLRVLASAVAALYSKLGEQPPGDFVALLQELTGDSPKGGAS